MSEIITGYIEDKQIKDSPAEAEKPWRRFAFKVNGKTFSSFDSKMDEFKQGELVTVEYNVSGNYNNIKTMSRGMPTQTPQQPLPQTPVPMPPQQTPVAPQPVPQPPVIPVQPIPPKPYIHSKKEEEASRVASMLISYAKDMVCEGKIEPGSLKANVKVLVETFKETKKQIITE